MDRDQPKQNDENVDYCNEEYLDPEPNVPEQMFQQQPPPEQNQARRQEIRYVTVEPPLTLNTWSQTVDCDNTKKIKHLEAKLRKYKSMAAHLVSEPTISSTTNTRPETLDTTSSSSPDLVHENRIFPQFEPGYELRFHIEPPNETENLNIPPAREAQIYGQMAAEPFPAPSTSRALERSSEPCIYPSSSSFKPSTEREPETQPQNSHMISLGPNNTKISADDYAKIDWEAPSLATRKLLSFVFDRKTLATHSLSGKASPAFRDCNKPVKKKLDAKAVHDIIYIVTDKCAVSPKDVRAAITAKCSDEDKMLRTEELKQKEEEELDSSIEESEDEVD